MSLRRVPRNFPGRVVGSIESMIPGTLGGRIGVASPIVFGDSDIQASDSGSVGSAGVAVAGGAVTDIFTEDTFTLASAGTQDLDLNLDPIDGSARVFLNGIEQKAGTDYTISGTTLSILTAMDARSGDVVDVGYAYTSALPDDPEMG